DNPTSYLDPTGYEILPASCYTGGNCDARKSSGPLPEERALIKFAGDTVQGTANLIGTAAAAIDPITAIRDPETAQFARHQLSQIPGQVHDGISDWGRDVGTISANPSVVIDAIEDLGEERAREAYFGGVLMSATAVQGASQIVRSGGSLGATAVSDARTAIPALRQSIREFSDRLSWKPMPPDLVRGTTMGMNGAGLYRGTFGRIGLSKTTAPRSGLTPVDVKVEFVEGMESRWLYNRKVAEMRAAGEQGLLTKTKPVRLIDTGPMKSDMIKRIYNQYKNVNPELADRLIERVQRMQFDHTVELQLGGADVLLNMRLLDKFTNWHLGQQISLQLRKVPYGTPIRIIE
ncbi:MAG: hypothetical protein K1X42_18090, partial [Opitutaceae bacterium]|nr:hypothetical protein [Opitutaceae bacterium]